MTKRAKEREGGCFCGRIRFRVMGEPLATTACHCRDCQRFGGAPFLPGAIFRADQVVFTSGQRRLVDYGVGRHRSFCDRCGSHLTFCRDDQPGLLEVSLYVWTTQRHSDPSSTLGIDDVYRG